jgi:hypothetical protein
MLGLAARSATVAALAALTVSGLAAPALAEPSVVSVTLSPHFGLVGSSLHVSAPAGLANVDEVAFGDSNPVPVSGNDGSAFDADVPPDATTGVLTLSYSDATPDAVTDKTFTVQLPTTARVSHSRGTIVFGGSAVVRAHLEAVGLPVDGQKARLQRTEPGSSHWQSIRHAQRTSSRGNVHWRVTPSGNAVYRVVFVDRPAYLGGHTGRTGIDVRPRVTLHVPGAIPTRTSTRLAGQIRPRPDGRRAVILDRRRDGHWHKVARTRAGHRGAFHFFVSLAQLGRVDYRVRRPHDASHLRGRSAVQRTHVVARVLRSGMSGPDVRRLQRRLHHLHYDVGARNGSFGYDTLHGVVAFQKVQGLDRDGVVGPNVWHRLADPKRPHLRHPADATATAVEVDLTKQVVYYAVNGHIRGVIDASTGGGYYYTGSDGTQQRAVTPRGLFHFVYKRDGWVHAPLGELYRPVYFNYDGYAIHGSDSIPPYPASHGCVRISVPAMDRYNSRFVAGMSVWIYR